MYQEVFLPLAPLLFFQFDGRDVGFCLYTTPATFCSVVGFFGFRDCGVSLLAYTDARIQV